MRIAHTWPRIRYPEYAQLVMNFKVELGSLLNAASAGNVKMKLQAPLVLWETLNEFIPLPPEEIALPP
jgi:hypothetical protein